MSLFSLIWKTFAWWMSDIFSCNDNIAVLCLAGVLTTTTFGSFPRGFSPSTTSIVLNALAPPQLNSEPKSSKRGGFIFRPPKRSWNREVVVQSWPITTASVEASASHSLLGAIGSTTNLTSVDNTKIIVPDYLELSPLGNYRGPTQTLVREGRR
jgi:hypothetical protein